MPSLKSTSDASTQKEHVLEFCQQEWRRHLSLAGIRSAQQPELALECAELERDEFELEPDRRKVIVRASNPRSGLYGVYHALKQLGFAWPRPGDKAMVLPSGEPRWQELRADRQKAVFKTRGWSVEGGYTLEQLVEALDWAAKLRINVIHFQFMDMRTFFRRAEPELSLEKSLEWDRLAAIEVCKRGMILQRGGHGFLPVVLDLPQAQGWEKHEGPVPAATTRFAALRDGARSLFKDQPANTQLCLSQAACREAVAQTVAKYAAKHTEAERLALWLGDGVNNTCQCADCRQRGANHWYHKTIQETVDLLKQAGLTTRLDFIAYTNLLQAPKAPPTLKGNLGFQFAPWGRTYGQSWTEVGAKRPDLWNADNELKRWPDLAEYRWLWENWRKSLPTIPGLMFDYHLWPAHYRQYAPHSILRTLGLDLLYLLATGAEGAVFCQAPVQAWPDGAHPAVQAALLWDPSQDPWQLAQAHLLVEYGSEANAALRFYEALEQRAQVARSLSVETSAVAPDVPPMKGLPPRLEAFAQFLKLEQGMERGSIKREEALASLGQIPGSVREGIDEWDLKCPDRFGTPWHRGVGWSKL